MSNYTQFVAKNPYVTPAKSEVTYDKYWLSRLMVNAPNPSRPSRVVARFKPARDIQVESNVNGETVMIDTKEVLENGQEVTVNIENVFKAASENLELADTMNKLFEQLQKIGIEQGVFENKE